MVLLNSEHPIQQGIRKGGGPHFCDEDEEEWRILGSWITIIIITIIIATIIIIICI